MVAWGGAEQNRERGSVSQGCNVHHVDYSLVILHHIFENSSEEELWKLSQEKNICNCVWWQMLTDSIVVVYASIKSLCSARKLMLYQLYLSKKKRSKMIGILTKKLLFFTQAISNLPFVSKIQISSFKGALLFSPSCWLYYWLFWDFMCFQGMTWRTSKITMLVDIQLIAAMGPPGGGRNPVTPRFIRYLNICTINSFSDETMVRIFSSIVAFYLRILDFPPEYFLVGNQIVSGTMEVSKECRTKSLILHICIWLFGFCIFFFSR